MVQPVESAPMNQGYSRPHPDRRPDALRTAALTSLILASVVLPFELKTPLFRIGPLAITSAELGIYLAISLWVTGRSLGHRGRWTSAHTAVAAFGAISVLSALCAPAYRVEAVKFALRSLGGCALFAAVSDIACTSKSAVKVGVALVAGSCLSALTAAAEVWLPGAAECLMMFKTQLSMIGSYLRASGTFQYANIASMYWEATLPLAMTFFFWYQPGPDGRSLVWVGVGSSLLLIEAILLGASRAGMLIAALLVLALLYFSKHLIRTFRAPALFGVLALFALIITQLTTDKLTRLRLTSIDPASWYRAEFQEFPSEFKIETAKSLRVPLTIRNTGRLKWRARGEQSVAVSYHWMSPAGEDIWIWEGARSEIPQDVEPGAAISVEAWIIAPAEAGNYRLQWDLVQKNVAWFSVYGGGNAQTRVMVLASAAGKAAHETFAPVRLPLPSQPSRIDLWRAAARMWLERPLLGVGPDNFRRKYGSYLGIQHSDDRIYANSLYLEMLATVGLMGTLAFAAVLIVLALQIKKAWLGAKNGTDRLLLAGIGMGLATYCIHGAVDYFLPFTPTYGLFWILAGMAASLGHTENSK